MTNKTQITSDSLFANNFSFMGCPFNRELGAEDIDVVILGIPFDLATTGRPGSRHGPQAIRAASANLRWEENRWPWQFNVFQRLSVVDFGDIEILPGESESMVQSVIETATGILKQGRKILSFGGDHFVTLPLLRAIHKQHGPVALIHFDAHTDTEASDSIYNHGSMFFHAPREGLISSEHSIQIGIRTEYDPKNHPFKVVDAAAANDMQTPEVINQIRETVGDLPVYLSFDIDALDPAYAPGTGTPVVGGLTTDKALKILRGLNDMNIVGMDIVEVAPCYDSAEISALAAATLALEMLYIIS